MQFGLAATSVRYTLVVTPAVILAALMILKKSEGKLNQGLRTAVILLSILFSLGIAIGDAEIANGYKHIVSRQIAAETNGYRDHFYFAGHWGFQYYAEQAGGTALDTSKPQFFKPYDLVVIAHNAWPGILVPQLASEQRLETSVERLSPDWPVNTVTCTGGANFYGNRLAYCERPTLLPFAFGHFTSETFSIHKILDSGKCKNSASLVQSELERPH